MKKFKQKNLWVIDTQIVRRDHLSNFTLNTQPSNHHKSDYETSFVKRKILNVLPHENDCFLVIYQEKRINLQCINQTLYYKN